jgi:2-deoxy-D-gluconate 3-dehydrogenase
LTDQGGRARLTREAVDEIVAAGGEAIDMALDVTSTITIASVMDAVAQRFGGLDILVNNAGVQLFKPALEIEEMDFDHVLAVNLKGAFFCAQAAAALMVAKGGGSIINVASQHGVVGALNRAPYCASKGGLINLTRALALEWADKGVRVNAVSPTFVLSDGTREMLAAEPFLGEIRRNLPLGRPAEVDEIAAGICYLASPGARAVTGHNLMIDGGWTAR